MFWLNMDISTGLWKLHVDSCRFCNPVETRFKGVNDLKKKGAWISFESAEEAKEYGLVDEILSKPPMEGDD